MGENKMKKRSNIVKIFGIGAAVLLILMALVPTCTATLGGVLTSLQSMTSSPQQPLFDAHDGNSTGDDNETGGDQNETSGDQNETSDQDVNEEDDEDPWWKKVLIFLVKIAPKDDGDFMERKYQYPQ